MDESNDGVKSGEIDDSGGDSGADQLLTELSALIRVKKPILPS